MSYCGCRLRCFPTRRWCCGVGVGVGVGVIREPQAARAAETKVLPVRAKNFLLVISYNPGYQTILKDLKQSTRQRFITLDFDYPAEKKEKEILIKETGLDPENSEKLVKIAKKVRHLKHHGLDEGVSTRLPIYAAQLIKSGLSPTDVCTSAITNALTDDLDMKEAIKQITSLFYPVK